MKLQRNHWILLALLLILVGGIANYFWSRWGLITVHSKTTPLSQVIRSIEKQGHVTIKTNIDLTKPVFMNVDEVTLNDAMETLSTVMEARWRLTYVVGPDKGVVTNALATFAAGQRPEGWSTLYVPLPPIGDEPRVLADPRKDSWVVKPAKEPTLQSYLQEASRNVSASFWVPESWNPPVKSPPKTGTITKTLSKLASASNSKYEEVIVLQGSNREAKGDGERDRDRGDGEPRFAGNFGSSRGGGDRSAMDERIENEINKLSEADRLAAQQERDRRKKMFEDMKDLTPEQRQARFQDMMSDPAMQDKMENQNNQRDNQRTPNQRVSKGAGYLSRKSAAMSAAGK